MSKQENPTNTVDEILARVGSDTKLHDHLNVDALAELLAISVHGALICTGTGLLLEASKRGVLVNDAIKFMETAEYRFISNLDRHVHPFWNPYTIVEESDLDQRVMTEVVLDYLDDIFRHFAGNSVKS